MVVADSTCAIRGKETQTGLKRSPTADRTAHTQVPELAIRSIIWLVCQGHKSSGRIINSKGGDRKYDTCVVPNPLHWILIRIDMIYPYIYR